MGAWTPQEVAYATRVADLYRAGSLPNVPDGITLRILLSKLLNCQPMRVSKKYSGESWSHHGKRPYRHVAAPDQRVVEELWLLEHAFHRRGAASTFRAPSKGVASVASRI